MRAWRVEGHPRKPCAVRFACGTTNWFAPTNPLSRSLIRSVARACYTEGESRIPRPGETITNDPCWKEVPARHAASRARTAHEKAPGGRIRSGRCGQGRDRTADLPLFRRSLIPTELPGQKQDFLAGPDRAQPRRVGRSSHRGGLGGLGPPAAQRSDPVGSFRRHTSPRNSATQTGLEPATFAVTGRRANQLRHWALLMSHRQRLATTAGTLADTYFAPDPSSPPDHPPPPCDSAPRFVCPIRTIWAGLRQEFVTTSGTGPPPRRARVLAGPAAAAVR
jgi:hypothetical protein